MAQVTISAVLVSYNTRDLLLEAVGSLVMEPGVAVTVVDNASSDGSVEAVERTYPAVRVIRLPTNVGFARGVNRGVAEGPKAAFLLLLNPDARLEPGALERLRALMEREPRAAVVAPSLLYPDGRAQDSAFRFPGLAQVALDLFPVRRLASSWINGRYQQRAEPFEVDHPLGACMFIRREAWEDVGPFHEGYFMYVEEVDWCRRARSRGWQAWHEPRAVAVHHGGQSTSQRRDAMFVELWKSRLLYYRRHHGPLFNCMVRLLVRLGMRAELRRAARVGRFDLQRAARKVLRLAR